MYSELTNIRCVVDLTEFLSNGNALEATMNK